MNIDELKQEIEDYTGIPANMLNGETAEENIAQAKALLAYKREAANSDKSPREQFADWFNAREGTGTPDLAGKALADIEERIRVENGGYPIVKDAGQISRVPTGTGAREQFAQWAQDKMAWNPRTKDGWTPLF